MAREPREEASGAIHHVIPRGNADLAIVHDDRDRIAFVARFARVGRELGWFTHASCLMDSHHHAVVETPEPNLGRGMRRVLGGHSRWMNVRYGRKEACSPRISGHGESAMKVGCFAHVSTSC
jgi:REP-associated tyrosine transposase